LYCDFHTHRADADPDVLQIVSVKRLPEERPAGVFFSLELHPWDLPGTFTGLPEDFVRQAPPADAIGEVGLDRLRGPVPETQLACLKAVLQLACVLHKPVIFHCVRMFPELLAAVRPYPGIPKLLHGFRGNEDKRSMLKKAGFLLSGTGDASLDGLETDASGKTILEIYSRCGAAADARYETTLRRFLKQT